LSEAKTARTFITFVTTSITPATNYRRYLAYLGLTVKKRKHANFLVTDLVPMAF
jgi:hypothetical protein